MKNVNFLIGGVFGQEEEVKNRGDFSSREWIPHFAGEFEAENGFCPEVSDEYYGSSERYDKITR